MKDYKIINSRIKQLENPNYPFYYLEVIDQDGNWWYLVGDSITWAEIKDIQDNEVRKGFIDTHLYERGNRVVSKMEPLIITETAIKQSQHPRFTFYYLEVKDQYGRWWNFRRNSDARDDSNFKEIVNIETQELRKGVINTDLYHFFMDDQVVKRIKRKEEVEYVYRMDYGNDCGESWEDHCVDPKQGSRACIMTVDGLDYIHDKFFYNYDKLKNFALKVKKRGVVNLEFWELIEGLDEWSMDRLYEFEEDRHSNYETEEWSMKDTYNVIGGEDGERKYMSDGAWINPDGTIDFEK